MTLRELPHRSELTGWTPARVLAARRSADLGIFTEAADFVEVLLNDDRVSGVLATRTHGLLGLPLHFAAGQPDAREILDDHGDVPGEWWRIHEEGELVKLQSWGLVFGLGLAQRIPRPRKPGEIQRYHVQTWNPRWLRYEETQDLWFLQTQKGEIQIRPGDGQWILYTPYGSKRPWASGLWNALSFPWLLKRFSLEDRANHSQTTGGSIVAATAPKTATERQRRVMRDQLRDMSRDSRFVLPEGWSLDFVESTARTYEIYTEQVSWSDQALTIVIAGQIVTTEGTPGFSSGNIHDQIKSDFIRFDAERLSTTLAEQSLRPWVLINWASDDVPWPIWDTEKPIDLEQRARTFEMLGRSIQELDKSFARDGKKVDTIALSKEYGIPVIDAPQENTTSVEIPLAPTDIAKVVRVDEARGSLGLGSMGEQGSLTIGELDKSTINQIVSSLGLPTGASPEQIREAIEALKGTAEETEAAE